ncbi:hypothetical protein C8A03DRAFT_11236 [Achaetomium macrosporum]|uniref:PLD phosphodiesterase domain-containing protein n=1 Tax=Achaetomium macrosporum TaxID=79813 RepID=A0AAN7HHK3_9PEZI|nr:hypothetical protein C8A03DRAFT_11236 [Achaetomium macrosporum]
MASNGDRDWAAEINGAEDDDEALRIAIALSLGKDPSEGAGQSSGKGMIDLTQDDDDDDRDGNSEPKETSASQQKTTSTAGLSGLAGLDRKKMEEERLARLGKRKAPQSEDDGLSGSRPLQRPRVAAGSSPPSSLLSASAAPGEEDKSGRLRVGASTSSSTITASRSGGLPFPSGVVKKTWAYGQPRQGDDIKIEEVLQKHQLELAVLSSYQWDEEWLLSRVDLARTKLILIAFAVSEAQKEEMRNNVPRDRIRFCFPPMQPMGAMHSKLMLLKYEKYMRVVIPTGNLMSFDWGESGTMENMVFIIDIPKFTTAEEREAQRLTPFAEELLCFLRAQQLDEKLVNSLLNYDFAETSRYHFVHTIPGSHVSEDAWKRTGYCGLGRAVSALGLSTPDPIELDFVCASLGAVNYSLLLALYYACQGDSGLKEYGKRITGNKTKGASSAKDEAMLRDHMRVYFPSRDTVLQSKGGKDAAGTICCLSKWWQAATFPREVLRDCRSLRKGLLMHSKVIYVRHRQASPGSSGAGGFAYVGSANLSESAWGRLVRDRTTGKPKLTCRNWFCGVLIPVQGNSSDATDLSVFTGQVPVPMEWPSRPYASDGGSRSEITPWFYQEG